MMISELQAPHRGWRIHPGVPGCVRLRRSRMSTLEWLRLAILSL